MYGVLTAFLPVFGKQFEVVPGVGRDRTYFWWLCSFVHITAFKTVPDDHVCTLEYFALIQVGENVPVLLGLPLSALTPAEKVAAIIGKPSFLAVLPA